MCKEAGAMVIIDDSLKYALDCSNNDIKVILFDLDHSYPWNKSATELPEKVRRVKCWTEVPDLLHNWAL